VLDVYAFTPKSSTVFYEDDGTTTDYLNDAYSLITVNFTKTEQELVLKISSKP